MKNQRIERVSVHFSPKEKRELKERADKEGMPMAVYIRHTVLKDKKA